VQSSTRTWKIQPLNMVIVEILERKGSFTDVELLEALKSIYKDLSINELNKTLMRMEITGLISVSSLTKGRRLVQLTKK
jgi:transcription initiation factor IIE alpha subunit